jgi:hypothetical protein
LICFASWDHYSKVPLPPPSPQLAKQIKAVAMGRGEDGGYTEYFRLNANGKVAETKYAIVSRHSARDDESSGSVSYYPRSEQRSNYPRSEQPSYYPRSEQPPPFQQYRSPGWGSFGMPSHNPNSVLRRSEDR